MTEDPLSIVIFVLIVCYLAALLLIARRLEKRHPDAWTSVGQFSLLNWSISSGFKILGFIFSGTHQRLDDRLLSVWVNLTRILIVVLTILIAAFALKS